METGPPPPRSFPPLVSLATRLPEGAAGLAVRTRPPFGSSIDTGLLAEHRAPADAERQASNALEAALGADDEYLAWSAALDAETARRLDLDPWLRGRRARAQETGAPSHVETPTRPQRQSEELVPDANRHRTG